jgi:hypothetical protein
MEQVIPTLEIEPQNLEILTTGVQILSESQPHMPQNPNDVNFKVSYPKEYKGAKEMAEGSIQVVSKETAEHFVNLKIGKIV